jgi:hypothetical protein
VSDTGSPEPLVLLRKVRFYFPEFNIRLYDKNSESDYLFFPPPKSEYFFQQHWESEYFFRRKTITHPSLKYVIYNFHSSLLFITLSQTFSGPV